MSDALGPQASYVPIRGAMTTAKGKITFDENNSLENALAAQVGI